MTLKLYGVASSRASRPMWLLEELGQPYELVRQDYRHGGTRTPGYLAINPNGHIPTLVDDQIIVWESMAITLYLARKFGGPLSPATLAEEAETLRWTFWSVTECEKDALHVLFQRAIFPPERRDEESAIRAEKRLRVPLRVLEAHLDGRDYVAADRFTVADVNVASVLAWARPSRALIGEFPQVFGWLGRCLERPAQRRVRDLVRTEADDPRAAAG
jgi:glutathione S-transferase